jgi:hypothetical protein
MLILLLFIDADSTAEEIWLRVGSVRTMNFEQVKPASRVRKNKKNFKKMMRKNLSPY